MKDLLMVAQDIFFPVRDQTSLNSSLPAVDRPAAEHPITSDLWMGGEGFDLLYDPCFDLRYNQGWELLYEENEEEGENPSSTI
jgi:hypothetical protein